MKYAPFLALLFSFSAFATIDCARWGIVDEPSLHQSKNYNPLSVKEALDEVQKNPLYTKETEFNLSGNRLRFAGAAQILEFAEKNLKNLKVLDLSNNQIDPNYPMPEDDKRKFETKLKDLLSLPNFVRIDLSGNPLTKSWIHTIKHKFGKDLVQKITFGQPREE